MTVIISQNSISVRLSLDHCYFIYHLAARYQYDCRKAHNNYYRYYGKLLDFKITMDFCKRYNTGRVVWCVCNKIMLQIEPYSMQSLDDFIKKKAPRRYSTRMSVTVSIKIDGIQRLCSYDWFPEDGEHHALKCPGPKPRYCRFCYRYRCGLSQIPHVLQIWMHHRQWQNQRQGQCLQCRVHC